MPSNIGGMDGHPLHAGEHGRLVPDEARREAKKLLGMAEAGVDPIAERQKHRAARTFVDVANDFMRLHVDAKRKDRRAEEYERTLNLHILPAIGAKRVLDCGGQT